jgi:hypothetical protein
MALNRKFSIAKLLFLFFYLMSPLLYSQAGWVITEMTTGEGTDDGIESILYIKDNKIKSVEQQQAFIIDLSRWQLTILDRHNEGYWKGTPGEYLGFVREFALGYLKEELNRADENDRPYLEAIYQDLMLDINLGNDVISFIGDLPVEIIMTDEYDRILGYNVNRFNVYADGIRVEEIWLTRDITLEGSYDYAKFRAFTDEMSWGNIFQDYRSSETYIHLQKQGLPLKTISRNENGTNSITHVVSIEKTDIPDSFFQVPPDYQPMDFPYPEGLF